LRPNRAEAAKLWAKALTGLVPSGRGVATYSCTTGIDVEGLKITAKNAKIPEIGVGSVKVEPETLRDAPDEIQKRDIAQFGACQAVYALPEGPSGTVHVSRGLCAMRKSRPMAQGMHSHRNGMMALIPL